MALAWPATLPLAAFVARTKCFPIGLSFCIMVFTLGEVNISCSGEATLAQVVSGGELLILSADTTAAVFTVGEYHFRHRVGLS